MNYVNEHREGQSLTTFTGHRFWPLDARPEEVCIEDIAHALSLTCCYAGHVQDHYSVAQHSVLVSEACDPADALWGLLHHAAEAYIGSVSTPIRHCAMHEYKNIERDLQWVICQRFRLDKRQPMSVHRADLRVMATEARDVAPRSALVMPARKGFEPLELRIEPLPGPKWAERVFLQRFERITKGPQPLAEITDAQLDAVDRGLGL